MGRENNAARVQRLIDEVNFGIDKYIRIKIDQLVDTLGEELLEEGRFNIGI